MLQKQWRRAVAALCCLAALGALTERPLAIGTSAQSAILIEASSGRALYEQNPDQQMLIASTTKIMTAIVALESCALDERVEITQAHMVEGSSMYLKPGETLTMEELLYGLMLCSGNDAALAVADYCGPGVEAFVEKMNDKAADLGMTNTSFANPNGLDADTHYSTARDMAALAAYAMQNETFARIVSTERITIGGRTMVNHNKLLGAYDGCVGLKTGYTKAAGRTLVSCAVRGDLQLIAVTLKDGNDWADHTALFDYGFSHYTQQQLAAAGEEARRVPLLNGTAADAGVCYGASFSYPLREGETVETEWDLPAGVFAPVEEGAAAGEVIYRLNGTEIGRVPLYWSASADALQQRRERGFFDGLLSAIRGLFR